MNMDLVRSLSTKVKFLMTWRSVALVIPLNLSNILIHSEKSM